MSCFLGLFSSRGSALSECLEHPSEILLARVAEGDQKALDELIAQHRSYVRRVVEAQLSPQLRARVDPSDIVQESLMITCRRIDDFLERRPTSFRLWIRENACQHVVDTHRRHFAQKRDVRRESAVGNLSAISLIRPLFGERASEIFRKKEQVAKVVSTFGELSEGDREILWLRYIEGLRNNEIAEILDVDPRVASTRHGRALRKLTDALKKHES